MEPSQAWLVLFAGLVSIKAHPRNEGGPDLEECARIADESLVLFLRRFPWRGFPLQ